jgi:hypothetical protein
MKNNRKSIDKAAYASCTSADFPVLIFPSLLEQGEMLLLQGSSQQSELILKGNKNQCKYTFNIISVHTEVYNQFMT